MKFEDTYVRASKSAVDVGSIQLHEVGIHRCNVVVSGELHGRCMVGVKSAAGMSCGRYILESDLTLFSQEKISLIVYRKFRNAYYWVERSCVDVDLVRIREVAVCICGDGGLRRGP